MEPQVTHSLVKALRSVPDFASLDDRALLTIVGGSSNLFFPPGSAVFEKGTSSDALYVILSGRVRIYDVDEGRESDVATVGPGDSFGELSLLLNTMHSKNAQATEGTELMVLPKESFQQVLEENPDLAAHFRRRLAERLPVRGQVTESA